jgi:hypothetical protein
MRCKHHSKQIESEEAARNKAKRGSEAQNPGPIAKSRWPKLRVQVPNQGTVSSYATHRVGSLWFYHCTTVVMVNPRALWLHHKIDQKTNTQLPVFSSHGLNLPYVLLIYLSWKFWPNRDILKVTLLENLHNQFGQNWWWDLKCVRASLGGKKIE